MAEDNVNAIISSCIIGDKQMGLVGVFQKFGMIHVMQLILRWHVDGVEVNLRIKILLFETVYLYMGGNDRHV